MLALLGTGFSAQAQQLQNPGFENWTFVDTLWDGQSIYTADQWQGASRTTESYSGTYAAKVDPILSCGIMIGAMIYGGFSPTHYNYWWGTPPDFTGSGAPISVKPSAVSGYFKFPSPDSNDVARGYVVLKKFNQQLGVSEDIGRGEIEFTPTDEYMPFTITVEDLQPGVMPDSIVVCFTSGMGFFWDDENNNIITGSLCIDQLRMQENIAGVSELLQMKTSFFPNPASGQLNYSFETTVADNFSLVITDASGRAIYSEMTKPGVQHTIDLGKLSAGAYHAQIRSANKLYANETIVIE